MKDTHTPGASVAIVHRDDPEWVAGIGTADVASGRAATADTLFRIGSVSKGFVALAVLMLVDQIGFVLILSFASLGWSAEKKEEAQKPAQSIGELVTINENTYRFCTRLAILWSQQQPLYAQSSVDWEACSGINVRFC